MISDIAKYLKQTYEKYPHPRVHIRYLARRVNFELNNANSVKDLQLEIVLPD